MPERVVIFIDGSNIYHILKEEYRTTRIDFTKLSLKLTNGRQLVRTYYYNAPITATGTEQYRKQQLFFEKLRKLDYFEVILGRLEKRIIKVDEEFIRQKHGEDAARTIINVYGQKIEYQVEKGTDINIAIEMLDYAYKNTFDTAVLISADGDFHKAIKAVKDLGKHVEVVSTRKSFSYHLRSICDKCIFLDDFIKECFIS